MAKKPSKPAKPELAAPVALTCEWQAEPLGLSVTQPRFSWQIPLPADGQRGLCQRAYQIRLATSTQSLAKLKTCAWNSMLVRSSASHLQPYEGPPLKSRARYYWQVRYFTKDKRESAWSEPASFEMGVLEPGDWQAKWISAPLSPGGASALPVLHRRFELRQAVVQARLRASAQGLYELWLNGQRVGHHCLTPGWLDYHQRLPYQTYDVTALLQAGSNAMGAYLADGWYAGALGFHGQRGYYGVRLSLFCQLELTYADGHQECFGTDGTWKASTGPFLAADLYHGEAYDARREIPHWATPACDDSTWADAELRPTPAAPLTAHEVALPRRHELLPAKTMTEPKPSVYIFDLGQNLVGWARLTVAGLEAMRVTLRYGERLNPDGTLYTANLRAAKCTDEYTCRGDAQEVYEPRFSFRGFRYVEVTGLAERPALEAIAGVVVHAAIDFSGDFACSHAGLTQWHQNLRWTLKGNLLEVPMDCPQRDERLGWLGDAQLILPTACYHGQMAPFFSRWLSELAAAQAPNGAYPMVAPQVMSEGQRDGGPGWADAGLICPWQLYLFTGDPQPIVAGLKGMRRYLDYLRQCDHATRHAFGDWLNLDEPTSKELLGQLYLAYDSQLYANMVGVVGEKLETQILRSQAATQRREFDLGFMTGAGRLVSDTQTAYALCLDLGVANEGRTGQLGRHLVNAITRAKGQLRTGILGSASLLPALTGIGRLDLAYELLLREDYPGWLYQVKQGATTIWERWDGWRHDQGLQAASMNSFNHYALGAMGAWLYATVGGVAPRAYGAGFQRATVAPRPGGGLTWARLSVPTPYGPLSTHWTDSATAFTLALTVPVGCEAEVVLPCSGSDVVTEGGQPVTDLPGLIEPEYQTWTGRRMVVGAGTYEFTVAKAAAKTAPAKAAKAGKTGKARK